MNNPKLLYSVNNSHYYNESDDESNHGSFQSDEDNINKYEYQEKSYNIIISTTDREWSSLFKETFSFQLKFNTSETSTEMRSTYSDYLQSERTMIMEKFQGSNSLSIPLNIKNIESIYISKLIMPNRQIYLGNGNFNKTINFKNILIHIDEISNVIYGTNDNLNKAFACMIGHSNFDDTINYLEFDNMCPLGKIYTPAPLNNINTLTFNFTDEEGNKLNYMHDSLSLSKLKFNITDDNKKNFIKITTKEYFSRLNYIEGDVVMFKNIKHDNLSKNVEEYINQKQGNKIYFFNSFSEGSGELSINNLENEFYISKQGDYTNILSNSASYKPVSYTETELNFTDSNNLLNRNLQLTIEMEINTKEKNLAFFNPEII